MKLILDTNAALEFKKFKLFWHLDKLAITDVCLKEIERLAKKSKKARIAYEILKRVEVIETNEKSGDHSIIKAAKLRKYPVFTYDKELIKKLREKNIPVINSEKEVFNFLEN